MQGIHTSLHEKMGTLAREQQYARVHSTIVGFPPHPLACREAKTFELELLDKLANPTQQGKADMTSAPSPSQTAWYGITCDIEELE
jgi:hypothetical protein